MRTHAKFMAMALVLGACSTAPEPVTPGPERARAALDATDVRAVAQLLRLEDQRHYDAGIFERLARGSEEVRRRTAMAAGRIGDPTAAGFLARTLDDDPSPAVRADAAFALGQLGDTSRVVLASLRAAVPSGWVPVREPETRVVVEVVHALGQLGSDEARGLVVDALHAAHLARGEFARQVAAEGLLSVWRFRSGPGRVNAAVRFADSEDSAMRWRAAYALMRLGEPDAMPALLTLLGDDEHRARANAARGLRSALVDSAGIRDTALVALTAALRDEHPHVRINAVRTLAGYGDDAPVEAMAALLDDPDPQVAIAAAGALSGVADAAEAPLTAVMNDPDRRIPVRAAATRALGEAAPAPVLETLQSWADGGFESRYAAARTLSVISWDRAAPLLRTLADDADRRVAVAALGSAGAFAADSTVAPSVQSELRALLGPFGSGSDPRLASVAVRAMAPLVDSTEMGRIRAEMPIPTPPVDHTPAAERSQAFYEDVVRRYVVPALEGRRPRAVLRTEGGEIVVELLAGEAPLTVDNFVTLARAGFWDDGVWHRVIPNFVLQDGAPDGDPEGGPGWSIRDEINRVRYTRGVMGMALSGPDTGGSQWFITVSPQHHLDGGYTIFGRVVDGMDVADSVLQGDPIESITVPR